MTQKKKRKIQIKLGNKLMYKIHNLMKFYFLVAIANNFISNK